MNEFSVRLLSVDAPPICEVCGVTERNVLNPSPSEGSKIARRQYLVGRGVNVHAADVDVGRVLQHEFEERADLQRQLSIDDSLGDALHIARLDNLRIEPARDPRRHRHGGTEQSRWYEKKDGEFTHIGVPR